MVQDLTRLRCIEEAWDDKPENRPSASQMQERLATIKQRWDPSYNDVRQGVSNGGSVVEGNPVSDRAHEVSTGPVDVEDVELEPITSVEKI